MTIINTRIDKLTKSCLSIDRERPQSPAIRPTRFLVCVGVNTIHKCTLAARNGKNTCVPILGLGRAVNDMKSRVRRRVSTLEQLSMESWHVKHSASGERKVLRILWTRSG